MEREASRGMEYPPAQEAMEKWGMSLRRVHRLCEDGRVEGTRRFGRNWMIPAGAEKPTGLRIADGKCQIKQSAKAWETGDPVL